MVVVGGSVVVVVVVGGSVVVVVGGSVVVVVGGSVVVVVGGSVVVVVGGSVVVVVGGSVVVVVGGSVVVVGGSVVVVVGGSVVVVKRSSAVFDTPMLVSHAPHNAANAPVGGTMTCCRGICARVLSKYGRCGCWMIRLFCAMPCMNCKPELPTRWGRSDHALPRRLAGSWFMSGS